MLPLNWCTQTRQSFLFLPNDVVGPCVTTTLHKNGVLLVHMWDQLSDLKNKFRTKRRPEKLGNLGGKNWVNGQ